MSIIKNPVEMVDGRISCTLVLGEKEYPHIMLSNSKYEISEDSEWSDIKPCDPDTKTVHEQAEARATFKAERTAQVAALTITTEAGNEFDADEVSQGRMARAILSMGDTEVVVWVLADNTAVEVAKAELIEALKLAGLAQMALWT